MSEDPCACVYVDDGVQAEFSETLMRKARKEHKCTECGRTIKPGERYEYVKGKWDGAIDVFKTCVDCKSVRDAFFCDGHLYGGIWELLDEHLRQVINVDGSGISSSCITPLTPAARDKVCDKIAEIWEWYCDDD